ncbi:Zinc finger MYM-type protein 1 [Eumeta japonica]|uniref:Zinc finger MYM-type protein 1 n=1 Tax=Eumeta variegata TaxID=151549 RepID=A0A4C1UAF4_EUMVA|nr:Zinc finger MYM-type protein 1 [Eumeta japonica]
MSRAVGTHTCRPAALGEAIEVSRPTRLRLLDTQLTERLSSKFVCPHETNKEYAGAKSFLLSDVAKSTESKSENTEIESCTYDSGTTVSDEATFSTISEAVVEETAIPSNLAISCCSQGEAKSTASPLDLELSYISHVDQLTLIVRYVLPSGPVERFVKFLDMEDHTAEQLAQSLLDFLSESGIDIKDCRGQSYDNASNMSGKYTGLQARIK